MKRMIIKPTSINPWLAGCVGLLILFLIINVVFIHKAFQHAPNIVNDKIINESRRYQDDLISYKQQNPLGWRGELLYPEAMKVNLAQLIQFSVKDKQDQLVYPSHVWLKGYRPNDAAADFITSMSLTEKGNYQTLVKFPLKGVWDIVVEASRGQQRLLLADRLNILAE